ncbi:MAG: DUF192 domain-containing protein [Rhodothermia bacterium]|nr:MAG: DUF192 domain-containing protein [Rhodothermia bacterium]
MRRMKQIANNIAMLKHRGRWCVLLAAAVFVSACGSPSPGTPDSEPVADEIPFRVDGRLIILREGEQLADLEIEIAETDSTRTRGMMQRTELPVTRGMLFIFDTEEDRFFWMANTPLSLDLIFVDADSTIIHMAKYMKPLSPQDVPSTGPAQYVLEMIAGSVDTIGLIEGDKLVWTRSTARDPALD